MKKFRNVFLVLVLVLIIGMSAVFSGCDLDNSNSGSSDNSGVRSIENIALTNTQGLVDTYTIYYTDGTTSTFTVTNGSNGTNGTNSNVSVQDLFDEYKNQYGEITYDEFLQLYLSYNEDNLVSVINQCLLSSAKVYTEFYQSTQTLTWGGIVTQKNTAVFSGSAVIWQMDSDYTYFVTNYHVVYSSSANADNGSYIARKINVFLYGSEGGPTQTGTKDANGYDEYSYTDYAIACEYVGGSAVSDIAVLRAPTSSVVSINSEAKPITCASDYYVGQTAIAIGNTEDEGISTTRGIVSVDDDYITLSIDTTRQYRSIRIDTSIYSGNSGGGLFNSSGELIGITNAGDSTDENINYAIPLPIVKNTVENILYYANTTDTNRAYKITLGLTAESKNAKFVYDYSKGYGKIIEDICVSEVIADSIAEQIGLSQGDILKSVVINGETIKLYRHFNLGDLLLKMRAGDVIKFNYIDAETSQNTQSLSYTIKNTDLNAID